MHSWKKLGTAQEINNANGKKDIEHVDNSRFVKNMSTRTPFYGAHVGNRGTYGAIKQDELRLRALFYAPNL